MTALVATLVAAEGAELTQSSIDVVIKQLEKSGAAGVRRVWLAKGQAADVFFEFSPPPLAGGVRGGGVKLGDAFQNQETPPVALPPPYPSPQGGGKSTALFDCFIQPVATRKKKLLIADMESTIIEQEMLDELADKIGMRDKVAAITARAMNGELDFTAALRERVGLLRGLPECVLAEVTQRITLMSGAVELLKAMKANGAKAWLVSGGFTCFVKPVAERLGFDRFYANELIVRDGMLTGEVGTSIVDKNTKKELLLKACDELNLSLAETMSVGDGANDVPMLAACNEGGGLGVAYHAKPNVRAVIANQINNSDLRALIYAQG